MKRVLSVILALIMTIGMSTAALAASAEELGSDNFDSQVPGKSSVVSKTARDKKGTYKITGLYYPSQGREVFNILNEERVAEGLPKLTWEEGLVQPAIQRALEQYLFYEKSTPLSHSRPDGRDWSTVSELANGENLAAGDTDAEDVMIGWMNSPGHRANILDSDFTSVAVVCVETDRLIYWVQLFHVDNKKSSSKATSTKDEQEPAKTDGLTAKSIAADLTKAKTTAANTQLMLKNIDQIPIDVLKSAANWGATNKKEVSITAATLTSTGKSTQGQLTFNPANFVNNKNPLKTGVRVDKESTSAVAGELGKLYPNNNIAVIKLDQSGSFGGGAVSVGAKANLKGLDTETLLFYYYDAKTGKATKIDLGKAGYSIDKNKYLRFQVSRGGYIVVTDKALK